jgi:hypothetical protein
VRQGDAAGPDPERRQKYATANFIPAKTRQARPCHQLTSIAAAKINHWLVNFILTWRSSAKA